MSRKVAAWVAVFSVAAAISVAAKSHDVPGGTVEYNRGILTVRLTQPTDLRTVLEAICQVTESRCDVGASAAEVELPPVSLTGTWREVVRLLMEGAGHNYAALEPSGGQGGRLWVEARPKGGNLDQGKLKETDARSTADEGQAGVEPQAGASTRTSFEDRERGQEETGEDPQAATAPAGTSSSGPSSAGSASAAPAPDPEQQRMTEQSLRMLYEGFTAPRPPQPTTGMITLPFVGPDGNFVTVPATNQPITVLPWPGPDGRPITVTPTPGVQLQWPIPATHGTSNPPR